jgi:hypothetical protein
VPKTVEIEVQGRDGPEKRPFPAPVQQIVRVGDKLFVANRAGVFVGPGTWRKVIPSKQPRGSFFEEPVVDIEPSEDGRTLVVTRLAGQGQDHQEIYERGHYDPKTGKVTFQPVERKDLDWHSFYDRTCFLSYYNRQTVDTDWVEVPVNKPGQWCVGPIPAVYHGCCHRVVESPQAVWIASPGQLVRLDRKRLREWLASR